jgi:hypothetical protein
VWLLATNSEYLVLRCLLLVTKSSTLHGYLILLLATNITALDFVTNNKHHNKNFGPNLCFQSNLISSKFANFGRTREKKKFANFFKLAKLGKKYPWLETQTINPAEPGNQ